MLVFDSGRNGVGDVKVESFNSHPSLELDLFRLHAAIARCAALAEFILANKNHIAYICRLLCELRESTLQDNR